MAMHTSVDHQGFGRGGATTSSWDGWIGFAAAMMILLGLFHAIAGLVALFKEDYYAVDSSGLVVTYDYTTWGWTHLVLGVVVAVAGGALVLGKMWARVVAVIVAMASTVVNFGFLSAFPVWSAIMIAADIMVIYAVTAHGRRDPEIQ